ncbi:MAG: molybdopterin-dependent oxidoreductase [Aeromicrobium sp.]
MNTSEVERAKAPGLAPWWAGALAGLLAAATGVSVATGVAAVLKGVPSPIESVGNQAIDQAPPFLKEFAVKNFGTHDKPILIGGVIVTLAVIAMCAGIIGRTKPRRSFGIVALVGLVAVGAAAIDRTATANKALTMVPSVLALIITLIALRFFLSSLQFVRKSGDELPAGFNRRRFLQGVLGTSALIVVGGAVGKLFGNAAAAASRAGIRIRRPADVAPPVPAGTEIGLKGVHPYITSNRDFYRVDTALRIPDVPAEGWSLRVHGMVDKELNLSFRDLMAMSLVERRITLTCVSNEVGGPYVGNATWIGVPIKDILAMAGVKAGADAIKTTSADDWSAGTPLETVTDARNAIIAIGMNGEPLPLAHGFPARVVVPGLYGFVSATKWLVDLEVSRFADFKGYWTTRDYDALAPIKMSSRIDVPRSFQSVPKDSVRIGGSAWAQAIGIRRVEIKVDGGDWHDAELGTEDNIETWRQWSWKWDDATPGRHTVTVRATDANGKTQTSERASIRPNGTTGWHSVQFTVT